MIALSLLVFIVCTLGCGNVHQIIAHKTDALVVQRLSPKTYQHISYLNAEKFGKVPCNGLIVVDQGEAMIIDAPTDVVASGELIDFISKHLKSRIMGVVATHFHMDCTGGLEVFHSHGITSYARHETIQLATSHKTPIPQQGFEKRQELKVGETTIINEFLGEGHTSDNIVTDIPTEKVLFGGCLIKSMGAGKGNLADANPADWPRTVQKVRKQYGSADIVVSGHGKPGGQDLLEYTIDLFQRS